MTKDCHGKSAKHLIMEVPVGTVIRNYEGKVIADMNKEGLMFVAARGGAGGKGNHFFISDTNQAPEICEFGADGEDIEYTIELRTMAHVGLVSVEHGLSKCSVTHFILDRISKCWEKHFTASNLKSTAQSCTVPVYNIKTKYWNGAV